MARPMTLRPDFINLRIAQLRGLAIKRRFIQRLPHLLSGGLF